MLILFWPATATAGDDSHDYAHVPGRVYTITCDGELVTKCSRRPFPGDEVYRHDGARYRVVRCRGKYAEAISLGRDKRLLALMDFYRSVQAVPAAARNWTERPVAIYHTHTDESYVPSDGRASIPYNGGIYDVGETFKNSLINKEVKTRLDKTPHDPHDKNAYFRSRRTAFKLLKKNPVAMFDIHRDGVDDPDFYRKKINGEPVTQLRLVVGRQNPKMQANLDFAKRLMAYANEKYPGLVMEIYTARGNYNQDLLSTALLIEAGTYTNYKENAKDGIALLADITPVVLGLIAPPDGTAIQPVGERAAWKTAVFLIILVLIGGAVFVAVNAGPEELERFTRQITGKVPVERIKPHLAAGSARLDASLSKTAGLSRQLRVFLVEKILFPLASGAKLLRDYFSKRKIR
jgi:stage II sporulation protein P